jgi:hypothetical protein
VVTHSPMTGPSKLPCIPVLSQNAAPRRASSPTCAWTVPRRIGREPGNPDRQWHLPQPRSSPGACQPLSRRLIRTRGRRKSRSGCLRQSVARTAWPRQRWKAGRRGNRQELRMAIRCGAGKRCNDMPPPQASGPADRPRVGRTDIQPSSSRSPFGDRLSDRRTSAIASSACLSGRGCRLVCERSHSCRGAEDLDRPVERDSLGGGVGARSPGSAQACLVRSPSGRQVAICAAAPPP